VEDGTSTADDETDTSGTGEDDDSSVHGTPIVVSEPQTPVSPDPLHDGTPTNTVCAHPLQNDRTNARRCGPNYGDKRCNAEWDNVAGAENYKFCNTNKGECGPQDTHQDLSGTDEYDFEPMSCNADNTWPLQALGTESDQQGPSPPPPVPHISYSDKALKGACSHHFETMPDVDSIDACARQCFNLEGCLRFSFGHSSGCRVTKIGTNADGAAGPVPSDGRCVTTTVDFADSAVYELEFYNVVAGSVGEACEYFYEEMTNENGGELTQIECAHKCKQSDKCERFSAHDGTVGTVCQSGCRISSCEKNKASSMQCPDTQQCWINKAGASAFTNCAVFQLDKH
jgi:hypothetical protein